MLVRSPNGTYEMIDFRETAPAAAFQDMYNNNVNNSIYTGLARFARSFPWSFLLRLTNTPVAFRARYAASRPFTKNMGSYPGNKSCREP